MAQDVSEWLKEHPKAVYVLVPLVALNLWFDYYHPMWVVLDVIIIVILIARSK